MSDTPPRALLERPARLIFSSRPRPLIMGIVNVTPDSFFIGSRRPGAEDAIAEGLRMLEDGADLLDVGGESTRPGSAPVAVEQEAGRVLPVIEALSKRVSVPISIDTSKAVVAERALDAGARILNDISALRGEGMPAVAVRFPAVILMHMLGTSPRTMQTDPKYGDVVHDISDFFRERTSAFVAAGGDAERVWLDPGIGFGKTQEHNLAILSRLEEFKSLGRPLLVGASRKSFIGRILGGGGTPAAPEDRLEGSLAAALRAAEAGAAAVRVHDVPQTRRALEVWVRVRGRR